MSLAGHSETMAVSHSWQFSHVYTPAPPVLYTHRHTGKVFLLSFAIRPSSSVLGSDNVPCILVGVSSNHLITGWGTEEALIWSEHEGKCVSMIPA